MSANLGMFPPVTDAQQIEALQKALSAARADRERYRSALEWVSQITEESYCDNLYSIEAIADTARQALEAK